MTIDWTPSIRTFCAHWSRAPTLQQTFDTLESEFARDSDTCMDAAKGMVECACRVLLASLDDPASPQTPKSATPNMGEWLSAHQRRAAVLVAVTLPNKEKILLAISPAQLLFGVDCEAYKLPLNARQEAEPEEEDVA